MRLTNLVPCFVSGVAAVLVGFVPARAAGPEYPPHPLWPDEEPAEKASCEILMPPGVDASVWQTNLWPGGVVPYAIDPAVSQLNRDRLRIAMDEISTIGNVTYVPRTNESSYIYVQNGGGNSSFVGRIGGSQAVNLVSWSERYVIIHELYHALGQWHEQQRPDRDTYVIINQANVNPANFPQNFNVPGGVSAQGPYNFESIMHYGRCDFSICGCSTSCTVIDPRPGFEQFANLMGNRTYMSQGDKDAVVSRYGPPLEDSLEDNDTLATAAVISPSNYSLRLTDPNDYFSVNLPAGGPIGVSFSAPLWCLNNVTVSVLTTGGTVLATATPTVDSNADGTYDLFVTTQVQPGAAIIRVNRVQPWGGAYQLNVAAACVPEPWKQVGVGAGPAARNEHALAFDSARGAAVLFGGNISGTVTGDTWEWNGSSWTQASTTGPSPRKNTMMTYDAARGVVVLFGGFSSAGVLGDTWEWNGVAWVERAIAGPNPPPRRTGSMCYDSNRGRVVLHSGFNGSSSIGDTWEYDGIEWTLVSTGGPPARYTSAMAFDPRPGRNVSVLFGGLGSGGYRNDTWEWNGTTWTQRSPSLSPSARGGHTSMAFDASRQRLVLFGGEGPDGIIPSDCWEYDDGAWSASAFVTPTKRYGNAMSFDSMRSRVICFGGAPEANNIGTKFADLWSFNGTAWLPLAGPQQPPARGRCELIADDVSNRLLLFGGGFISNNSAIRDFWVHKNGVWGQYHLPTEGAVITGLHSYASAFDSARNRAVIFGGVNQFGGSDSSNTWELNPSGWDQAIPATVPPARQRAAMAYDAARAECVMFGGRSGASSFPETWTYDGTDWTQAATTGPGLRYLHAMAYDPVRQRVVCFGGIKFPSDTISADTWEWDGASWNQITPSASPPARYGHKLAYDAERGAIVLFGGNNNSIYFTDTWTWNGSTWQQVTAGAPDGRDMFGFAPEPGANRLVMFGGIRPGQDRSDTWRFDAANDPPVFTSQPQSTTVNFETQALFNAPATDVGNFSYRWFATTNNAGVQGSVALNDLDRNGRILGVFTSQLRINSAQPSDATTQPVPGVFVNQYFCVISNACQSATSNPATLAVTVPPPVCVGDLTGDNVVNVVDLTIFLGAFGTAVTPGTGADFDGNGVVNVIDLTIFLGRFGQNCP